jgi:hypothetical protein
MAKYCSQQLEGSLCHNDEQCLDNVCAGNICSKERFDNEEVCSKDTDCKSGACARNAALQEAKSTCIALTSKKVLDASFMMHAPVDIVLEVTVEFSQHNVLTILIAKEDINVEEHPTAPTTALT